MGLTHTTNDTCQKPGQVRPSVLADQVSRRTICSLGQPQQSHSAVRQGKRVSDRTMVGPEPPCGLRSTQPPNDAVTWKRRSKDLPPHDSCQHQLGLDARELSPLPTRMKCFLLASPSIAPGDRLLGCKRAAGRRHCTVPGWVLRIQHILIRRVMKQTVDDD
jgi:hypothetical protein